MNASGIAVADALRHAWANVAPNVRFLILAIADESIVLANTIDIEHDLASDLILLHDVLHDNIPAYVLARLDEPPASFLAITYVPDTASVRDKMLYASSRTALTRSLGAASFPDSLFATSKTDLTPAAYSAHLRHLAAPQPLSAREQELATAHAAEHATSTSAARQSPLSGARVQLRWSDDAQNAVAALPNAEEPTLVVFGMDPTSESVILISNAPCTPSDIGGTLPSSEPSFALFAWPQPEHRDTIFIYSCPSSSRVKQRMLFSSSAAFVLATATTTLGAPVTKRLETSEPQEVDEAFLRDALGSNNTASGTDTDEKRPFAKPRGPMRKQR